MDAMRHRTAHRLCLPVDRKLVSVPRGAIEGERELASSDPQATLYPVHEAPVDPRAGSGVHKTRPLTSVMAAGARDQV